MPIDRRSQACLEAFQELIDTCAFDGILRVEILPTRSSGQVSQDGVGLRQDELVISRLGISPRGLIAR